MDKNCLYSNLLINYRNNSKNYRNCQPLDRFKYKFTFFTLCLKYFVLYNIWPVLYHLMYNIQLLNCISMHSNHKIWLCNFKINKSLNFISPNILINNSSIDNLIRKRIDFNLFRLCLISYNIIINRKNLHFNSKIPTLSQIILYHQSEAKSKPKAKNNHRKIRLMLIYLFLNRYNKNNLP